MPPLQKRCYGPVFEAGNSTAGSSAVSTALVRILPTFIVRNVLSLSNLMAMCTPLHQSERDAERTKLLERYGIEVIRFENDEVLHNPDFVLETIRRVLRRR